jgi:hypothetical protein
MHSMSLVGWILWKLLENAYNSSKSLHATLGRHSSKKAYFIITSFIKRIDRPHSLECVNFTTTIVPLCY